MHKPPDSLLKKKIKITVALVLITLCVAGLCHYFIKPVPSLNTGSEVIQPPAVLENIRGGWWQAEHIIYHGIPARIVFFLPPETGICPVSINQSVWQEFDRIGNIFNPFDPDSEIFLLNAKKESGPALISGDVNSVIHISKQLWQDTDGNFDPTIWPLKQVWQSAEKNQQIPTIADIARALQKTGFDKVRLGEKNENSIEFVSHPVKFDFGGVVKGYAVDQVRQLIKNAGIPAALIQLGGEISAFGNNDEKPWRIGVQHPKQMNKIWGIISKYSDIRVSTSGNYRQPITINGKSFYHIFSPRTGKPVSEKVLGVTTVSIDGQNTNARLDGTATAITVMGAEKGLELAKKLQIEAIVLYEINNTIEERFTPGLAEHYQKQDIINSR